MNKDNKVNEEDLENCPVKKTLLILQGKWNVRLLYELSKGDSFRFGELKKTIPEITNTMLTQTLRELETQELLDRKQYNEIPPHVEYTLTAKGKELSPIFQAMAIWGTKYL